MRVTVQLHGTRKDASFTDETEEKFCTD